MTLRRYLRSLLAIGTFFTVFGMMMTSICKVYWHFILAQGICTGLGMTCLFMPCVAVLPPYFSTKRSLAMGLGASGSSVGTILFAVIFQQLLPRVGFGWTARAVAFVILASLLLPLFTMQKRITQSPSRALIDSSALQELPFVFVLCSQFVVFVGLYGPHFYIEVFSISAGVLEPNYQYLHNYLIIFMNAASLVGRLIPEFLTDKVGSWNTIVPAALITGIISFAWMAVTAKAGLIAFAVFYGFCSGSFVALTPVVWAILSPNMKVLGTRIGMMTVPMAAGLLIGNPIAGAILRASGFVGLQAFCGSTVIAGALFLLAGRVVHGRSAETWKV